MCFQLEQVSLKFAALDDNGVIFPFYTHNGGVVPCDSYQKLPSVCVC